MLIFLVAHCERSSRCCSLPALTEHFLIVDPSLRKNLNSSLMLPLFHSNNSSRHVLQRLDINRLIDSIQSCFCHTTLLLFVAPFDFNLAALLTK